jgi:hypothetical protein
MVAAIFEGNARASSVVAVDHYAIKAWRAIVRKAEQFIPELLWTSQFLRLNDRSIGPPDSSCDQNVGRSGSYADRCSAGSKLSVLP